MIQFSGCSGLLHQSASSSVQTDGSEFKNALPFSFFFSFFGANISLKVQTYVLKKIKAFRVQKCLSVCQKFVCLWTLKFSSHSPKKVGFHLKQESSAFLWFTQTTGKQIQFSWNVALFLGFQKATWFGATLPVFALNHVIQLCGHPAFVDQKSNLRRQRWFKKRF